MKNSSKDISLEEAKSLVEEFIRAHLEDNECVYPSDVADELDLEYEVVRRIFQILEKEEKICQKGD